MNNTFNSVSQHTVYARSIYQSVPLPPLHCLLAYSSLIYFLQHLLCSVPCFFSTILHALISETSNFNSSIPIIIYVLAIYKTILHTKHLSNMSSSTHFPRSTANIPLDEHLFHRWYYPFDLIYTFHNMTYDTMLIPILQFFLNLDVCFCYFLVIMPFGFNNIYIRSMFLKAFRQAS